MVDPRDTLKAKLDTMHARLHGDPELVGMSELTPTESE
jgi:hypothetical protein